MQIDFHYYGTYVLARAAGLTPKASKTIAYSSQYVDDSVALEIDDHNDGSKVIAVATAHHPADMRNLDRNHQRYIWVPFHFLPGGVGKTFTQQLVCRKNSIIAQEMTANALMQTNKPFILELIGITAHVYADTFAHYGFSGVSSRRNRVDGNSIQIDHSSPVIEQILGGKIADFFEKYGHQGGLLQNIRSAMSGVAEITSGALGHGAVCIYPDQPYLKWRFNYEFPELCLDPVSIRNNQQTYLEGAKALYDLFVDFGKINSKYCNTDPIDFTNIIDILKEIFAFEASKYKRIDKWQEMTKMGHFYKNCKTGIPKYNYKAWEKQHNSLTDIDQSSKIGNTEIYRFYQAASYHRHYILRELLPKHGIIAV